MLSCNMNHWEGFVCVLRLDSNCSPPTPIQSPGCTRFKSQTSDGLRSPTVGSHCFWGKQSFYLLGKFISPTIHSINYAYVRFLTRVSPALALYWRGDDVDAYLFWPDPSERWRDVLLTITVKLIIMSVFADDTLAGYSNTN